jgi:hypothetical protein
MHTWSSFFSNNYNYRHLAKATGNNPSYSPQITLQIYLRYRTSEFLAGIEVIQSNIK